MPKATKKRKHVLDENKQNAKKADISHEAEVNPSEKQMRIVLLGKTGDDKSATGNTILDEKCFESTMMPTSVTSSCRAGHNASVRVIDTPGFFDTSMSNDNIENEIFKCVAMSAPGPHAFIVVVRPDRFTQEVIDTVNLIKETFGQDVMRYMLVLFVKGDLDAEETTIDDYLKNSQGPLKNLLIDCGNRYIAFNNLACNAVQTQQSCDLIDLVHSLVERNGGKCYSNEIYIAAEKAMCAEENKRKQELEEIKNKEIESIQEDIRHANQTRLNQHIKKLYEKITKLEQDAAAHKGEVREQVVTDVGNNTFSNKFPKWVRDFTGVVLAVLRLAEIGCQLYTSTRPTTY